MSKLIFHGRALYYPYLEFHDINWLKTAALYYDGLDRIVPRGFFPTDGAEVRKLNDSCDLIRDIDPANAAKDIAPGFLEFVQTRLTDESERRQLLQRLRQNPNHVFTVMAGKTGIELIDGLRRLGFTVNPVDNNNERLEFDEVTGSLYMAFLANHLGAKRHTPVVTDDEMFQPLIRTIQLADNGPDPGHTLATLAIKCALPAPAQEIPVEKIVRFRHDYKDERDRFSKAVNAMTAGLEQVIDEQTLEDIINDKHQELKDSADELSKALWGIRISTGDGLLCLSATSTGVAVLGPTGGVAGAIVTGGKTLYSAYLDRRKARAACPAAYLLRLRKLEPHSFIENLAQGKLIL